MKKFIIQIFLLLIVIGAALFFFAPTRNPGSVDVPFLPQTPELVQIQIGAVKMNVEVADTPTKRSKGLGGRDSLAPDSGMLFLYDKADRYNFWMKGVKFPLDFIWIMGDKVVDLTENVPAANPNQADSSLPVYTSRADADKILEVNAGFIKANNIKIGDTINIQR